MVVALVTFWKSSNVFLSWSRGGRGSDGIDVHRLLFLGRVLSGLTILFVPELPLVVSPF